MNLALSLNPKFPVHLELLLFSKKTIELMEKLIRLLFQGVSSSCFVFLLVAVALMDHM